METPNLLAFYRQMLLIRHYEEKLAELYAAGNFPMSCSSHGQEASAVGVVATLSAEDSLLTNHRSASHLLARGADPGRMVAEIMGKATGYCGGKSGSLHISVRELGVLLTSTIVGGELSLAPGVALSRKMLKEPGIVACFFGDGAACEGIFHESLNLAALWQLPLLFVCENNEWQAFVNRREALANDSVAAFGHAYGVPSASVDGNDVQAVHTAAQQAVDSIRRTGRPYLLETRTYRLKGHISFDTQAYVDATELAHWQARDPLLLAASALLDSGQATKPQLEALAHETAARIDAAVAFAQQSPFPDAAALTTHVYA